LLYDTVVITMLHHNKIHYFFEQIRMKANFISKL
jgi:hypothetical protein